MSFRLLAGILHVGNKAPTSWFQVVFEAYRSHSHVWIPYGGKSRKKNNSLQHFHFKFDKSLLVSSSRPTFGGLFFSVAYMHR